MAKKSGVFGLKKDWLELIAINADAKNASNKSMLLLAPYFEVFG